MCVFFVRRGFFERLVQFSGWTFRFTGSTFRLEFQVHRFTFQVGVSGSQVQFPGWSFRLAGSICRLCLKIDDGPYLEALHGARSAKSSFARVVLGIWCLDKSDSQ